MTRAFGLLLIALSSLSSAQTVVYDGREYVRSGRSWFQLREVDPGTGRMTQITTAAHDHWRPWCMADGTTILFTPSPLGGEKLLSRFDRKTK